MDRNWLTLDASRNRDLIYLGLVAFDPGKLIQILGSKFWGLWDPILVMM